MAVEGPVRRATAVNRRLVPQADFESELRETLGDHPENEETSAREFLTGGGVKSDVSALPPHPDAEVRRREGHAGKAGKFKTVSQLVLAMNRFKASINPTYTFGKRPPSRSGSDSSLSSKTEGSRRTTNEEDLPKFPQTYGHKTAYLMTPLPPAPTEIPDDKHDV